MWVCLSKCLVLTNAVEDYGFFVCLQGPVTAALWKICIQSICFKNTVCILHNFHMYFHICHISIYMSLWSNSVWFAVHGSASVVYLVLVILLSLCLPRKIVSKFFFPGRRRGVLTTGIRKFWYMFGSIELYEFSSKPLFVLFVNRKLIEHGTGKKTCNTSPIHKSCFVLFLLSNSFL